jgi:hypothetical protein
LSGLPPAPVWSDALEQQFDSTHRTRGGPEATGFLWTNRATSTSAGPGDTDNFGATFGTSAPAARAVVDQALGDWSRVITSFNRSDGTNTIQVSISIGSNGGFGGAGNPASQAPLDGKPRTGAITINTGNNSPNPNDSNGWFLDPTTNDYSEFQGTMWSPFAADQTGGIGSDLYSVVVAEATHVLGLISPRAGDPGPNYNGYLLINSNLTQATNLPDNAEGGGNKGFFYVFNGPSIRHAMTSYNSGDTDNNSWGNVIHTAGGGANFPFGGFDYRGTEDDGNAAGGNERTLPSWVTANILKDAYGYSIENPAKFGTMMAVLDRSTGRLTIRGRASSDDTIFITSANGTMTVSVDLGTDFPGSGFAAGVANLSAWVSEFQASAVTGISIDAGSGDDTIILDQVGTMPMTVNGNAGADQLIIKGSTGYDTVNFDYPTMTGTNLNIRFWDVSEIDSLRIDTRTGDADLYFPGTNILKVLSIQGDSGNETINLHSLDSATPATFFMGSGHDTVNIQVEPGFNVIESPVTVHGGDGNDTVTVMNLLAGEGALLQQPITFNGDAGGDTLNINDGDRVAATITFNGGGGGGGVLDDIEINDGGEASPVEYDVTPTSIIHHGFLPAWSLNYSNVQQLNIYGGGFGDKFTVRNGVSPLVGCFGNSGNDTFIFGDGLLTPQSGVLFNAGAGIDTITFDDHNDANARLWQVQTSSVIFAGAIVFATSGFEGVAVLAGNGNDTFINEVGTFSQAVTIDAGGGQDTVQMTGMAIGSLTVRGGTDSFPDFLTLDDRNLPTNMSGGFVYADHIRRSADFPTPQNIYYSGFSAVDWYQKNNQNLISVYGVSPDIGTNNQFWIGGGTADDFAEVYPFDPQGNPTILGNLAFNGADGPDTLRVFNNSTTPANYRLFTQFGGSQLFIDGGGNHWIEATNPVENVEVYGSGENDSFAVEQIASGASVKLFGQGGDDTCTIGNGDMSANLTNAAAFTFNGQSGSDRFTISNGVSNSFWTYTIQNGSIVAAKPFAAYSWTSTLAGIESQYIFAGSSQDSFSISAVASGLYTECNGAAAPDTMALGAVGGTLENILGPVVYNAGADGGSLTLNDTSDTTGDVVHLDANSLGAYAGDTLFGPGGSLRFSNLTGLLLNLGSGADTVYAQPQPNAQVTINAGNPTTTPGDVLNLATAALTSPVVNGTPASGSLTSSNRQTLSWNGFEGSIQTDAVAPAVNAANINLNGIPGPGRANATRQAIDVQFSEDVSGRISPASLQLTNLTTGQPIPTANIAVQYEPATNIAHFTFPGYLNGVLPDGNYSGKILAGLPDFFGNALPADAPFTFFFLNGDADHDRDVDVNDLGILATNWQLSGRTFSQGDFDYSGTVDVNDLGILASHWQQTLAASPAPFASAVRSAQRSPRMIDQLPL